MKLVKAAILVGLALCLGAGCGDNQTDTAMGEATTGGVILTLPPGISPPGWGFNPDCMFPGSNTDPKLFSSASVGGKLQVSGALLPGNNGTFAITGYETAGVNPGNIFTGAACTSETFPASAVVTYFAP